MTATRHFDLTGRLMKIVTLGALNLSVSDIVVAISNVLCKKGPYLMVMSQKIQLYELSVLYFLLKQHRTSSDYDGESVSGTL